MNAVALGLAAVSGAVSYAIIREVLIPLAMLIGAALS